MGIKFMDSVINHRFVSLLVYRVDRIKCLQSFGGDKRFWSNPNTNYIDIMKWKFEDKILGLCYQPSICFVAG